MFGHTPQNVKGSYRSQSNETCTSFPLFARFGTLGLFLFGDIKDQVMGYRAETPSELLVGIRVILAEIPRETLKAVFLEWMERLQKCVQIDGKYVG
jgi:hypothetical protein